MYMYVCYYLNTCLSICVCVLLFLMFLNRYYIYIYIYIYLCGITFVHKRVLNYHIYRWKEQNNYVGEK